VTASGSPTPGPLSANSPLRARWRSPWMAAGRWWIRKLGYPKDQINGNFRILKWRYLPYIRPIFQAYVRGYPPKIWPYMVQYLHFRILEFPLTKGSMVLLYMVITWIPSIYPSYVSIYTSTMDPMGINKSIWTCLKMEVYLDKLSSLDFAVPHFKFFKTHLMCQATIQVFGHVWGGTRSPLMAFDVWERQRQQKAIGWEWIKVEQCTPSNAPWCHAKWDHFRNYL